MQVFAQDHGNLFLSLNGCAPGPVLKMSLYCRVNNSEIKTNREPYHEHSHLKSSPWSPHGSDEGPAVLFGVITLHSPQTLLSIVASCRSIKYIKVKVALL